MCLPDFGGGGGGGGETSTVNQTSTVKLPAYLEQGGQQIFDQSKPLANRQYPVYDQARLAGFNPDQLEAFQRTRENVGAWQPIYQQALASTAQSGQAVGQNDVNAYMNPYTQNVVDSTVAQINRQADMDKVNRNAQMAQRGSFLNEDRRAIIDNEAEANRNRVIGETVGALNLQGFNNAMNQGNIQRDRDARTASMYSQLAPQASALGYGDIGALMDIGGQQEAKEQQGLSLQYEDFLRQFYYPQEQQNWLTGILRGSPYGTSTQTSQTFPNPGSNTAGNILGGASAGAGIGSKIGTGNAGWGALGGGILGMFG